MELKLIEQVRQQSPLLLLDDVFSELDAGRRQSLTAYLNNYQTFLTTTDADILANDLLGKSNVIKLNDDQL